MTQAELKKVFVVEKILDGRMTNQEGAKVLGLSIRQIIRLKKRYLIEGAAKALAHRNRGRKPKHALSEDMKNKVTELYSVKYHVSNNCHFVELLEEYESIRISPSSVRRILLEKGINQAKQRRRGKAHRPREQKPGCCGKSTHTVSMVGGSRIGLYASWGRRRCDRHGRGRCVSIQQMP